MRTRTCSFGLVGVIGVVILVSAGMPTHTITAGPPQEAPACVHPDTEGWAGTWYWLRSPDQERRVIASLYNRYCVRCHGVDGAGVWDIPDVPDLSSARWHSCRSDAQLVRGILEGRGAVMPAFRGTLTLEEAWAMARYLRTFIPGTEASRPNQRESTPKEQPKMNPADVGPVKQVWFPMLLPRGWRSQ